jgi:xanthine dehydrogenase YagT iron-sulfur-binding subunit
LKQPPDKKPGKSRFSRRGFIGSVGVAGGAIGAGILAPVEQAEAAASEMIGPAAVPVTLDINGRPHKLAIEPRTTLCDALRNHLEYTGSKRVCDRGTCGACTVIVDGKAVYSCTMLAIDAQGRKIETLEGISTPKNPHPVSEAFVKHDAQQCGYCTPGFVVAAKAFLDHNPNPTPEQVKEGLGGNLCRCGTYVGVRAAVLEAAKSHKGGSHA